MRSVSNIVTGNLTAFAMNYDGFVPFLIQAMQELDQRLKNFRERKLTVKSVSRLFRDQLLLEDFRQFLYDDTG